MVVARTSIALSLILGLVVSMSFSQTTLPDQRVNGWSSDINFLLAEAARQHYIYKSKPLPELLLKEAAALKKNVPQFSDERMLAELQRLISLLGDGHSYVLPWGAEHVRSTILPVRFYLFSDGLFIIDAQPGYEQWIGSRVVRLGKVTAADAMSRIGGMISEDNTMGTKWIGPILLGFRGDLEAIGVTLNSDTLSLSLDISGHKKHVSLPFVPVPRMRGLPKLVPPRLSSSRRPPLFLSNVSTNYWFQELPDKHAMYFQFNQVANADSEQLGAFAHRLDETLTAKPSQLLIVDVRHNNGGNADLLPPLIDTLKKFEDRNSHSRIVVITGRNTFSAAQIFINLMNRETKAIFAGEPSSSKPNFVGEENGIVFPYSGAIGSVSNRYHEIIPGDGRRWIEPQIKVELSSRDYFVGRDPVLDAVLAHRF